MLQRDGLDPQEYVKGRLSDLSMEFVWKPGFTATWKSELRARLATAIGLPQRAGAAPCPNVIETRDMGGYVRETITYETRPGLTAFGYLLTPKGLTGPAPAVICVPGHGVGVDAIVGAAPKDYQNQFAIQCVEAGFVTLAIEPIGFGHRMSPGGAAKGSSCSRDSMAALMLGETMIGWRCFDAMVSLNLLLAQPNVDPDRTAIMGISGGGLVAFWTACLDERFAAAVVSGYFNTFFDSILSIDHCVDNYAPGLAGIVEMPDMAALIAPRKLFVESGTRDEWFPGEVFTRACERAEEIYQDAGAPEAFGRELFVDDHVFSGRLALPRLKHWFGMNT